MDEGATDDRQDGINQEGRQEDYGRPAAQGEYGQLGVVWVIFGAFGAGKGDKASRGAGCEPYSSRPPSPRHQATRPAGQGAMYGPTSSVKDTSVTFVPL